MFEALKQASAPNLGETHEDQLAQIPVDIKEGNVESDGSGLDSEQGEKSEEADSEDESRGIDLMASDNEDDEKEIDLENEQYYPFSMMKWTNRKIYPFTEE